MEQDEIRAIIDEVKAAADIVEIVGMKVELKRQGKDWFAPCPFHLDKDPSFSVIPNKQMFHCFGCGAGGDVFEFWSQFHNLTFWESVKAIADMVGVKIAGKYHSNEYKKYPEMKKPKDWEPTSRELPCGLWREKAKAFVFHCYERLFDKPDELRYLASRGIKEETIGAYGLGWCEGEKGGDLYRPREKWGLETEYKADGQKKRLWLPVGIVIPYLNEKGEVLKIRIRRPDPITVIKNIRYYFVPGGSGTTTLINPDRPAHVVIESDLDAFLIAQEVGDLVGVVCLSTSQAKPDEKATETLRKSLHILNALDFDNAGAQAWPWWEKQFPECVRWPVPKGKDPGEAFKKSVDIRKWVKAGLPPGLR